MDRPGIEHGPPKNLKEFCAKNFRIYVLTEKQFWLCLKNSCLLCIGIRIINTLKTEAARLSEMLKFKCKILRFPTQKNINDMKVGRSVLDVVKASWTCRFYKLVNPLPDMFKFVAVGCTSMYFVCKLNHCLWHEGKSVFVTPVHLTERPTYLETAVLWTLS